ncbi:ABC transporter permease [Candidatus Electronema sp. PJ]|jgi:spermidine/putrescine transport system permease protein|uniref:ABC transporter permease n=1 Tax=Candidatus Electronema sp. PJ TaxID=3401572 RepID=UPI003AA7F546
MTKPGKFSLGVFLFVTLFLHIPLAILVISSFNSSKSMRWEGFSLTWYHELFYNSESLWHSFYNSFIIAISSAAVATVIGSLGAIGLCWYNFRMKKAIQTLTFFPIILPEIIIGVSILIFFNKIGLNLSLLTVFLAHVTFNIPFVLMTVMARLEEFDFSIIEAAYDLGASELAMLFRILLPISMPGIIAGLLLAITLSLEDFVITFFVAGPGSSTLPLHIFSMIRFGVSPTINALSVVIIVGTALLAVSTKNLYSSLLKR